MEFNILNLIEMISVFLVSTISTNEFILHKNFKQRNVKKVLLPPELTESDKKLDIDRYVNSDFIDILNNFIKIMQENFSDDDLMNFYNNLSNVNIKVLSDKEKKSKLHGLEKGIYSMDKNEILVDNNFVNIALFHELLHMAVTNCDENTFYSGFEQYDYPSGFELGCGLNEGYTEVIRQRYFYTDDDMYCKAYDYESRIASLLEQIVGKDKMEKLYLNTNLPGLIKELEKYSTKEETINFLTKLDFVNKYLNTKSIPIGTARLMRKSMDVITLYLLKVYKAKIEAIVNGQEKDTNNLIHKDNFISDVPVMAINGFKRYEISNDVEMTRRNSHREIDKLCRVKK